MDDLAQVVRDELKKIGGNFDSHMAANKARHGELSEQVMGIQARTLELEQRAARPRGDPGGSYDGGGAVLRQLLEASADLKAVAANKQRRAVIDLPPGYFRAQITSGGGLPLPETIPGIVAPAQRRFTIRSLIPSVPTTAGSMQYLREVAFTNAAASVSETIAKPESDITFELKVAVVSTLAHWIRVSTQCLDDWPQLQLHIDGRLRYGLAYVEEEQLLKGSGTGNNLQGLMTVATAFSGSGSGTRADILRRAVTQLAVSDLSATGIVLHPSDWETIELLKDSTLQYIWANPRQLAGPSLWGLPVVSTNAQTAGSFLVADFPQAALILDREQARVDISTEDGDNFVTNRATIRAEERLGLAILRTLALVKGTF